MDKTVKSHSEQKVTLIFFKRKINCLKFSKILQLSSFSSVRFKFKLREDKFLRLLLPTKLRRRRPSNIVSQN